MQQYWSNRRREDIGRQMEEFESEWERRRQEEGEYFDEDVYEFERSLMERRMDLENRSLQIDEEMHKAYQGLLRKSLDGPAFENEQRNIERRFEDLREKVDDEFRALEDKRQRFWDERAAMHEEFESEGERP